MEVADKTLIVQLVGQMLITDGILADAERDHLDKLMERLQMTPEERKAALRSISLDSPLDERARSLSPGARSVALQELETAMGIDGETGPRERALLERVRELLT